MNETVNLSDPACPFHIEYSRAAMEQIRKRTRDGLLAAPRVGMAVGGLLLGVRDDSRIRLLDSVDLPCSHSTGPSFSLTPEEKQESRELVAEANLLSTSSRVGVVGWYCSKTRGEAVLSDSDLELFAELFPGSGQIALVLRPDVMEETRAAFFFRDAHGAVVKGLECDVDEWRPAPKAEEPEPEAEPVAEITASKPAEPAEPPQPVAELPKVVEIRQPPPKAEEPVIAASVSAPAKTSLEDIIGLSASDAPVARPAASRPVPYSPPFTAPLATQPMSRLRIALLTVAAVLALGVVAYFTEDFWLPRPALNLTFTQLDGSLLIQWDPEALRGIDHASMYVNDGGQAAPSVIPLDRLQLNSGQLSFTPKSNRVTAKLDAGKTSAFNSWVAPAQPKPQDSKPEESKQEETPPAASTPDRAPPQTPRTSANK